MPIDKDHLPEFDAPPLNEVVLGVQFQTPAGYGQIQAYEVWKLYADKFPIVREQPPMFPQFEMFGVRQQPQFSFNVGANVPTRYWFENSPGDQLIQFQADRLFHNWRKVDPERAEYPRFESIIAQFEHELRALESYFQGLGNERLFVTQCELGYHNNILIGSEAGAVRPEEWLSFLSMGELPVEDMNFMVRRVLERGEQPYGRLYCESATGTDRFGRRVMTFNLTARGLPAANDIAGVLDFLVEHRYMIAEEFVNGTTEFAHKAWKRSR